MSHSLAFTAPTPLSSPARPRALICAPRANPLCNTPRLRRVRASAAQSTPAIPLQKLPTVAVVGRPNVGKSTLVNRLTHSFSAGAIVEDVVGITRDRTYRPTEWAGYHFRIVDTGGLVFDDQSTFLPEIRAQALLAIQEASAVILCVDGQAGLNPLDIELASFLRKSTAHVPVFIAVNKCESHHGTSMAFDFWQLGLGEPVPVSAIHGSGTGDLLDLVVEKLPKVEAIADDGIINVAIVGRPNVGKSSLLNLLAGSERAIVSEVPGTTRDAIDEIVTVHGNKYRLIDTAGIRRKTNVSFGTEFFMINRAFKAIRRADVVLLMLDVCEESEQDRKIADRIVDEGKACVVLANKWDLVPDKDNSTYMKAIEAVQERTVSISWAPVELISVLEKKRVTRIISLVDKALEQHQRRVSTSVLNDVLREAVEWHKPPSTKAAKQGRIYYCTQVASRPPTIAMFVNDPRLFHDNYRRYMLGQFRKALGFFGTPVRLVWRGKARAPSFS
ncbi:GTPase Der [Gracilariopsis chorda]|uniref:GTPase Der n=1 Tax=Gracilariopsis chorda TaxID=448386 RepID=A0A2V3IUP9_9FLOR|nr:GTPase Der [Gracilariopsis chorda]|eukprot:PXF45841.1 GTPase Der [Gracilariopsis chorda]